MCSLVDLAVRHADALPGGHDQAVGVAIDGKHVPLQAPPAPARLGGCDCMGHDQDLQAGPQRGGG